MKKFILSLAVVISFATAQAADLPITDEVKTSFRELFGSVHNVQWSEDKGNFTAVFYNREVKVVASFTAEGEFKHSIRYYKEDGLPTNLRKGLSRSYKGKEVFGVTEVTVGESTAYFVKMQDAKHWYTIKVTPGGENEMVEKYNKI